MLLAGVFVTFLLLALVDGTPFRSVEVRFSDASGAGLKIVPASCHSAPGSGCSLLSEPPVNGCSIGAFPSTITQGDTATLAWDAYELDGLVPLNPVGSISPTTPAGGPVNPTDTTQIIPGSTTTYTYSGTFSSNGQPFSCQTTVSVVPPGGGACTAMYFCTSAGTGRYFRNAQCSNSAVEPCPYGCVNGQCLAPDAPTVTWSVRPQLVRSGESVRVTWSGTDLASCQVSSDHGDSWPGISGARDSKPVTRQTVFTLSCAGNLEGSSILRTETVNVIPVFQET